jgi:hypothetical protein
MSDLEVVRFSDLNKEQQVQYLKVSIRLSVFMQCRLSYASRG